MNLTFNNLLERTTWTAKNSFFFLITDCLFVISLSGEVTEDELFSRLQQIKDGPEQQNNTPSTESGEDPVGKFASFLF